MKSTGIVRGVDKNGRVVIPQEIRSALNIESNTDSLEIFTEGDTIVLKKYKPACFFCDTLEETVNYNGYNVCVNCIEKLKKLADGLE